jgi:hypothetical protein
MEPVVRPGQLGQWTCILGLTICLTRLSVCAASPDQSDEASFLGLPISVLFNRGAGHYDYCFIPLQLRDGEKGLFIVETGCPVTVLDKSLEKMLGKRLGRRTLSHYAFGKADLRAYAAPSLYLHNTKLKTGDYSMATDLRNFLGPSIRGRPVMGILGADCLQHYCVRFDFISKRLDFLDPSSPTNSDWGRAFPLFPWGDASVAVHGALAEAQGKGTLIDTGYPGEVMLEADLFQKAESASREPSFKVRQKSVCLEWVTEQ